MLENIIGAGIPVTGVFLPGVPGTSRPIAIPPPRASLPIARTAESGHDVTTIAHRSAIPVFRVGRVGSNDVLGVIESFAPDALISICYPRLIPRRVTSLFPGRALNVHTSLLPDLRGPDPMFWTLRRGDGRAGVTIHHLTEELDAGPIVAQARVDYVDGTTESELESQLAAAATGFLTDLLVGARTGSAWPAVAQDESTATLAPFPSDSDFVLDTSRPARSAFNFVRGVNDRGVPVTVEHQGKRWVVTDAVTYSSALPAILPSGEIHAVPFLDGYLLARLKPTES